MNKIRVAELFAGVGGFRLGLEGWERKSASSDYKKDFISDYEVVWSNQWEPSTRIQHASRIYVERFPTGIHINEDISKIEVTDIPNHDLLVGGFPCQDYSVARTLSQSSGLIGKKGVLWWEIHRILREKGTCKPKYLFLENVDRLLKSPAKQRGRDFAIMLASLAELGYTVEWRIINAADYGMPQRRRRTFILAYHSSTTIAKASMKISPYNWILNDGILARSFEVTSEHFTPKQFVLSKDLEELSKNFNSIGSDSPFCNTGYMANFVVNTIKTSPVPCTKPGLTLGDVLEWDNVPDEFYIHDSELEKWKYLKGAKRELRQNANGGKFFYTEGSLPFPDPLNRPARTIITSEGGKTASRFKHVVSRDGRCFRRLIPSELEKLNMFPAGHTEGVSDTKRAFFMGNALVVGIIEKVGLELAKAINSTTTVKKKSLVA